VLLVGCNGEQGGGDKEAYTVAVNELKDPVAVMAAFEPYLEEKKDVGDYVPKRRPDEVKAAFYAANEIRHAANRVRQRAARSASPVVKELGPALAQIVKLCADPDDMKEVESCRSQVKTLGDVLKSHSDKSAAAGVPGFPVLSPDSVTGEGDRPERR
jgi:hypothetical protein